MLNKVTKFAITCLTVALFAMGSEVLAAPLVSDGFESYGLGTIHNQGTTWHVGSYCDGDVVSELARTGSKSLNIMAGPVAATKNVTWYDDVGLHGGNLELSW